LHHVGAPVLQVVGRQRLVSAKCVFWCKNGAETVQFSGAFRKLYLFFTFSLPNSHFPRLRFSGDGGFWRFLARFGGFVADFSARAGNGRRDRCQTTDHGQRDNGRYKVGMRAQIAKRQAGNAKRNVTAGTAKPDRRWREASDLFQRTVNEASTGLVSRFIVRFRFWIQGKIRVYRSWSLMGAGLPRRERGEH